MSDPRLVGFGFMSILVIAITGIAVLINRGRAKPAVVGILLVLPFLYLFGVPLMEGEIPLGLERFSGALIVAVIGGLIAGVILHAMTRK